MEEPPSTFPDPALEQPDDAELLPSYRLLLVENQAFVREACILMDETDPGILMDETDPGGEGNMSASSV
jgi:hypothetical protein